jgi:hypothetical protein
MRTDQAPVRRAETDVSEAAAVGGSSATLQQVGAGGVPKPGRHTTPLMSQHKLDELLEEASEIQRLPLPPDERHPSSSQHTGRIRSSHYSLRREPSVDYTQ